MNKKQFGYILRGCQVALIVFIVMALMAPAGHRFRMLIVLVPLSIIYWLAKSFLREWQGRDCNHWPIIGHWFYYDEEDGITVISIELKCFNWIKEISIPERLQFQSITRMLWLRYFEDSRWPSTR